ncbi:hypothetical protein GCM10011367_24010 [Marinicauda pacifica]|nr:hypothetical protein GCM10011367_24010 [Marinicauda pacifica]
MNHGGGGLLQTETRFDRLFRTDAGERDAFALDGPACPPPPRPGGTLIDAITGLAIRLSLAALLWRWARSNAQTPRDWTDLMAWALPEPGFVAAVSYWLPGGGDQAFAAAAILAAVSLVALALAAGLLTRIAGFLTLAGALWYAVFILPEAWTSAFILAALGLYLLLRGGGPLSIDFATLRLTRFH